MSTRKELDAPVKELARAVAAKVGLPLAGGFRGDLEEMLRVRVGTAVDDCEAWLRARTAMPSVDELLQLPIADPPLAGAHVLRVWSCECGQRWDRRSGSFPPRCVNCKQPMEATEIPVRKLPDAFQHVNSALADPVKYVRGLSREIERSRQAAVGVTDLGGFRENCVLALRWASEAAGYDFTKGRIQHDGTGWAGYVRWFADDGGVPV